MVLPVVMYGCWIIKKTEHRRIDAFGLWCWRRLLRVPWMARRSNQSILKEINPEYSLEGTDAEGEAPILWPPDVKNWLIGKDANAGKDWRQEEKGTKEDEMVGWHHWHEFEQAPGDGEGQWGLACCSPWGRKEPDMTEQLNDNISSLGMVWLLPPLPGYLSMGERLQMLIVGSTSLLPHKTPWSGSQGTFWDREGPCGVPGHQVFLGTPSNYFDSSKQPSFM